MLKSFKKFGQTLILTKTFFWCILGPDDRSQNFFSKRTSMNFPTNDHFPIFIFWLNLSSTAIKKKVPKMPNFENDTALLWPTCVNNLKKSNNTLFQSTYKKLFGKYRIVLYYSFYFKITRGSKKKANFVINFHVILWISRVQNTSVFDHVAPLKVKISQKPFS